MACTFLAALLASLLAGAAGYREVSDDVLDTEAWVAERVEAGARTRFLPDGILDALTGDKESAFSRMVDAFRTEGSKMVIPVPEGLATMAVEAASVIYKGTDLFSLLKWAMEATEDSWQSLHDKVLSHASVFEQFVPKSIKQSILSKVKEKKKELEEMMLRMSGPVILADVDFGSQGLIPEELQTLDELVGTAEATSKTVAVLLNLKAASQPEVQALLQKHGFPSPGDPLWIDLGESLSDTLEDALTDAVLTKVVPAVKTGWDKAKNAVKNYFDGDPVAYFSSFFAGDEDEEDEQKQKPVLSDAEQAAKMVQEFARKHLGKTVAYNIGLMSPEARALVAGLLKPGSKIPETQAVVNAAANECVRLLEMRKHGDAYVLPPVMREAIADYCESKDKHEQWEKIIPFCSISSSSISNSDADSATAQDELHEMRAFSSNEDDATAQKVVEEMPPTTSSSTSSSTSTSTSTSTSSTSTSTSTSTSSTSSTSSSTTTSTTTSTSSTSSSTTTNSATCLAWPPLWLSCIVLLWMVRV